MATAEPNWRPSTLGGFLAFARDDADLSQEALAEACGVSRPLVSHWERDLRVPEFSELEVWAKTTGAKWLIPTLKKLGLLVKVERWEVQTAARKYRGLDHLELVSSRSEPDRRFTPRSGSPMVQLLPELT